MPDLHRLTHFYRAGEYKRVQHKMKNEKDPVNALTVDVEDYFQVEAFADVITREQWGEWESRIERNTRRLLELFEKKNVTGTFFVLGWIAKKYPGIIREIAELGHEIACHG
jgi:peptidoglycan/xylan/chitin deacetylase (PgdA/CDA1 family)